jgi:hypothetical protein
MAGERSDGGKEGNEKAQRACKHDQTPVNQ